MSFPTPNLAPSFFQTSQSGVDPGSIENEPPTLADLRAYLRAFNVEIAKRDPRIKARVLRWTGPAAVASEEKSREREEDGDGDGETTRIASKDRGQENVRPCAVLELGLRDVGAAYISVEFVAESAGSTRGAGADEADRMQVDDEPHARPGQSWRARVTRVNVRAPSEVDSSTVSVRR